MHRLLTCQDPWMTISYCSCRHSSERRILCLHTFCAGRRKQTPRLQCLPLLGNIDIPYSNLAAEPFSLDVVCYLGLESVFSSMLSQDGRVFFDFSHVARLKMSSTHQCFIALSPATTPRMLMSYLDMAERSNGTPRLETLWHLMMRAMMHMQQWLSRNRENPRKNWDTSHLSVLFETIVHVALQLSPRDEIALLIVASMDEIPPDSKRIMITERRAMMALEILVNKDKQASSFSSSDQSSRSIWDYRWLEIVEENLRAICHQITRDSWRSDLGLVWLEHCDLQFGLLQILELLPAGRAVNQSAECFYAVSEAILVLVRAMNYEQDTPSLFRALEAIVSTYAIKTDMATREKLLSPFLLYAILYHGHMCERACPMLLAAGARDGKHATLDNLERRPLGATGLDIACNRGLGQYIRRSLVEYAADDSIISMGSKRPCQPRMTALIATCSYENTHESGADALIAACSVGIGAPRHDRARKMCDLLLSSDADVNAVATECRYGTALIAACAQGRLDLCRFLLSRDADPNISCSTGPFWTALIAACSWQQGIDYRPRRFEDAWEGSIIDRVFSIRRQMCDLLLDHDADANAVVHGGGRYRTALIAASIFDDADICRRLIVAGADVDVSCAGEYTSALTAARVGTARIPERTLTYPKYNTLATAEPVRRVPISDPMAELGRAHALLLEYSATESGFLGVSSDLHGLFEIA